jgi:hypothetical protein
MLQLSILPHAGVGQRKMGQTSPFGVLGATSYGGVRWGLGAGKQVLSGRTSERMD